MKTSIMALLISVSLVGSVNAVQAAEQPSAGPLRVPENVDLDSDGRVSMAEHLAWEKGVFITNDLNGDGYITTQEISQRGMERVTELRTSGELKIDDKEFAAIARAQYALSPGLDTDGDGRISLMEHLDYETSNFKTHDLDNDGYITMQEIALRQSRIAGERIRQMQIKKGMQQEIERPKTEVRQESLEKQRPAIKYQE